MVANEQVRPLAPAAANATSSSDEEEARNPQRPSSKKRRRLLCLGCCGGTIIILGVVILVLALTVFKVKDPRITVNSINLERFSTRSEGLTSAPALNLTLRADVSIKNPNAASFRFGNSTTDLSYRGRTVGQVHGPAGRARARRTLRMNVTVDVLADQLNGDLNLLADLLSGTLEVNSHTSIGGRVSLLRIIKRHVDIVVNCTVLVAVSNQTILDQSCTREVSM